MRRSRMLPENPPSKPPPEMRGGNAGAGARGRERGTKCGRGPGGRSHRQNPPPKAWGRMWGAGLCRSTGPGYAARNTGPVRETGAHRPEHGTGVRAGVRGPKREAGCEGGVRGRGAGVGARGPECEDRSAGSKRKSRRQNPPPKVRGRGARAGTRNEMREGARGQEPPPESAAQSVGQNVGGRSVSEHGTGVRRPEHGTGARDRSAPPGTRDRSASRGAWAEARGRVRGRGAGVGARGPECGLEAQEPSLPEHGAGV